MSRLWIRDPLAIFADGAERGLIIEGHRIAELVAAGQEPQQPVDTVFDASQHVVLPGLINTHHHFYQTLTRALVPALGKELFGWLRALYPVWARVDPEMLSVATELALTELLLSGCTTTSDHHYIYPAGLEPAVDIQAEVASRLGIRVTLTRGSMDRSIKDGGLPPDTVVQKLDTILADCERVVAAHHQTGPGAMMQVALAPCSPFSVSGELMRETVTLADRLNVRTHTHLGETENENQHCEEQFGMRPLDYLEECGWLHPRTWLAHGIHFTDSEIDRLGRAAVGISHCPHSNMYLASGICPACAIESSGAAVGLGVDGSASNDASNLIEEVRQALLLQRLGSGAATVGHVDALRWATEGGARCLGRDDIGRIEPGLEADLALFRLDELRHSGGHDPLATLVVCGTGRADRVMVGGAWRVEEGHAADIDEPDLMRRHNQAARRLRQLAGLEG
jgi:8-oxoguanine deaminase